jgi:hypothetical protein
VVEREMTPGPQPGSAGSNPAGGASLDWVVDGWPKGVTEQRLTLKRCVGRNVHPASLRGEGISLAVHDGGWQACRRATDGSGGVWRRAAPVEGSKSLLPTSFLLAVGEAATPPASGAGDRRFESCRPDLRGRGEAVLASLMSSRSRVRIPPALLLGGVAQRQEQSLVRRKAAGSSPVVPVQFMVAVV